MSYVTLGEPIANPQLLANDKNKAVVSLLTVMFSFFDKEIANSIRAGNIEHLYRGVKMKNEGLNNILETLNMYKLCKEYVA